MHYRKRKSPTAIRDKCAAMQKVDLRWKSSRSGLAAEALYQEGSEDSGILEDQAARQQADIPLYSQSHAIDIAYTYYTLLLYCC